MKECTNHLCKRLVGEHYAAAGTPGGGESESEDLDDAGIDDAASGRRPTAVLPWAALGRTPAGEAPKPLRLCPLPSFCRSHALSFDRFRRAAAH